MHERTLHEDFITEAVTQGAGLEADCYELSVLRMFRREYIAALDDGETVLCQYHDKAPRIIQAMDELTGEESHKVWATLYVTGVVPAVLLITSGKWDEAYRLYRSLLAELEAIFLKDHLDGYSWLQPWIEAKLAETPVEALDAAAHRGVVPLQELRPVRRAEAIGGL